MMCIPRPWPARWRLPRRTARLRLTILYGGVFLLCGAALLAINFVLVKESTGGAPASVIVITESTGAQGASGSAGSTGQHAVSPAGTPAGQSTPRSQVIRQSTSYLDQLLIQSGKSLAVVAIAAVALAWFLAGRVLRPLSKITAAARRISASSLHERLALRGPDDELMELGNTLDLFGRLEASFDAQRHFVANASHELRTPITRERTLLQLALADPDTSASAWRSVGLDLLATNKEHASLIEALLTLASSEGGLGEREPVDLALATTAALAAADPEIGRLGLSARTVIQPAALDGDPLLIQQLAANLVSNAVRHNIPGGIVQVATRTTGGRAVLSVANSGKVIPPSEVRRLFQPFQRLGPRRAHRDNGHGLGLSIVHAIAAAHGADIHALAQPDGGLAIDVTFCPPAQHRPRQLPAGHETCA
jgi:signal transduction histidine kinase